MPSGLPGLEETNSRPISEKKKPDFIRSSANGSLEVNSHKSQSALLELPHRAMILRNSAAEDKDDTNSSRALMKKAHELHNISKSESKKSEATSIANRAHKLMQD